MSVAIPVANTLTKFFVPKGTFESSERRNHEENEEEL